MEDNGQRSKESVGGLVSGLKAYLDFKDPKSHELVCDYTWIGWPGATIKDSAKKQ